MEKNGQVSEEYTPPVKNKPEHDPAKLDRDLTKQASDKAKNELKEPR